MKINRFSVLKKIKKYAFPLKGSILLLMVINAAAIPVTLISPRFFQILIDDVLGKREIDQFVVVVVGLLGVYVIRFILDGSALFFGNRLLNGFTIKLRFDVFARYQAAPYSFLIKKSAGDLKMRIMDDVDCLGSFIKNQLVDWLFSILLAFFSLLMCLRIDVEMTLYCLAILPFVFMINWLIGRGTKKVNEEIRQVNAEYYTSTHNSLQFWKEIKAQNAETTFINRFKQYRQTLAKLGMRWARYWGFNEVFSDFKANYLTRVLIYIVGAFFVIKGQLTVGTLLMYAEYYALLFGALDTVNNQNVALRVNMPFYQRVFDTLSFPGSDDDHKKKIDLTGEITIRDLNFGYREQTQVLNNLNLHISPGDSVAVVGKTGCGKTTLAKLLLGLHEPDSGKILYDGVPLSDINKENLYAQIGVVMQDSFLFDMSIRDNLLLAKENATESHLASACAQASILQFVQSLSDGFDTIIGERGVKLSGGQKQRLCIARALLKKPKIIIFDEATSALDRESEEIIHTAVNGLAPEITIITIAHKPDTILRAKRIAVMVDGKIQSYETTQNATTEYAFQ